jgi:hypothetical protein
MPLKFPEQKVRAFLLLAVPLAACTAPGPTLTDGGNVDAGQLDAGSYDRYEYGSCEIKTGYCPRDLTFYCALDSIAAKYGSCTLNADCVEAHVLNCVGYGACRSPVVNSNQKASFEAEASVEADRYCEDGTCNYSASCAFEYDAGIGCVNAKCVWLPPDGGF